MSLLVLLISAVSVGVYHTVKEIRDDTYISGETIIIDGKEQGRMEVSLADIVPGTERSYTLVLKPNRESGFDMKMEFKKTDTDTIAQYIDVEIKVNGQSIASDKLDVLLSGKKTEHKVGFNSKAEILVEIIYKMSLDIGDEAQGTSAEFDVKMTFEG